ncbi:glycerophosphodiester phosphodiesterase [soil metagenome]
MRWSPALRQFGTLFARPIAHRGLHDRAAGIIENTRSAFAAAMAGDYAIECDLQVSADGEAMVFHDSKLDRLMRETGSLRSLTADEIRKATFKAGRDRIQTLDEMLTQVDGKVPLVIEIKSHFLDADTTLVQRAADVLAGYTGTHALMSFDPDILEAIGRYAPDVPRGIVTDRTTHPEYKALPYTRRLELRHFTHLERTRPDFISYDWKGLPYPPVTAFREAGNPVISWTIREPAAAAKALRYSDQITFEGFRA